MSRFRAASYNIRKCVGLDRRRDPDRILSAIAALDADIVALQEADRRLGARPTTLDRGRIEAETGLSPVEASGHEVSLGWHGNAILVSEAVEVTEITRLDLPGLEPRGAVMMDARVRGARARIVAVHLGLVRRFRLKQLEVIAEAAGDDLPTVILGDFNEWRGGGALFPLADRYEVHAPGHSFHAARPIAALDRIAVSPEWELRDAGVAETAITRVASDHLPVWADLGAAS